MIQHLYLSGTDDPYLNIALEKELSERKQSCVLLWTNSPCVIAGRNQNLYAEADLAYAEKQGILPVRRYTGGGCVYHDHGNLNYSWIIPEEMQERIPGILKEILNRGGIDAELSGRNDLMLKGRKLGGTAWLADEGWILYHGTLLIDADRELMERVLTPSGLKLKSKGIASVKARIINLKEVYPEIDREMLKGMFEAYYHCPAEILTPDEKCRRSAEMLKDEKWIYGECAQYEVTHEFRTERGILRISLRIKDGFIVHAAVDHDYLEAGYRFPSEVLEGMFYKPEQFCGKITALILEGM